MWKKSHAPLFTLFVYFTHLLPPTGLFWTNFLPCHLAQFVSLPFQPKRPLLMAITVWRKQKLKLRSTIRKCWALQLSTAQCWEILSYLHIAWMSLYLGTTTWSCANLSCRALLRQVWKFRSRLQQELFYNIVLWLLNKKELGRELLGASIVS